LRAGYPQLAAVVVHVEPAEREPAKEAKPE
jgi:hypothetical protein